MRALIIDMEIALELSYFVTSVKALNAMDRTDLNRVAQNVLVPIFAETYGFSNLHNLDIGADGNFPGIDLADDIARVAIQVTSTPGLKKVKHTLTKFLQNRKEFNPPLAKRYDRVIIYILTERQKTYSQTSIDALLAGRFQFDSSKDIWDFETLLADIQGLPISKKEAVLDTMKEQIDFTRSLLLRGMATGSNGDGVEAEVRRRCLTALDELWELQRRVLPVKRHLDMDWDDALEDIALQLASHSESLRRILDRDGVILPRTVADFLENAAGAAQDGFLEMSHYTPDDDVPRDACRYADQMYRSLSEAIAELRISLAKRGILD